MLISKIALTKDFIRLTILIVVVALILEVYYNLLIVPEFKHLGFNLNFNIVKYILSKFLLICLLALSFIIYSKSKFLYSIFLLLLFFFYIPNSILFSFANGAL